MHNGRYYQATKRRSSGGGEDSAIPALGKRRRARQVVLVERNEDLQQPAPRPQLRYRGDARPGEGAAGLATRSGRALQSCGQVRFPGVLSELQKVSVILLRRCRS